MFANGARGAVPSLKILMTADAVGGVWQYSLDLISQLTNRGAQILLATMGPRPTDAQKQRLAQLPGVIVCESDYKLEWMQQPWRHVDTAASWLLNLSAQFQPDVIHLNGYAHAVLPWKAPVLVVAHSCVYSWWNAVHRAAPPAEEWSEYHRRIGAGVRAADLVIAPSEFMANAVTKHYGRQARRIRIVRNYSESPLYNGRAKEPFYLAAGRIWDVGKNVQILNGIADRLPWPIHLAGNNQVECHSQLLATNLHSLGSLTHENVTDRMQRASIYVHPALYEPFGLAVLEAARAQCCLVLSDIPSLRELWDGAAVFLDPRDPDQWAHSLTLLASNPLACESLGRLARQQARLYSAASAIEHYWAAYQSLAGSTSRRSKKGAAA